MNPYDRSPAFGKCVTSYPYVLKHFLLSSLCKIVILQGVMIINYYIAHLLFLQLLVQMACVVKAENSKSGMAAVPLKGSQKVSVLVCFCLFPKPKWSLDDIFCFFLSREVLL